MKESPMLDFPVQEYENRMSVLTTNMKAAGLDGVMITSMESVRYFTGLQSVIWPSKLSTPGLAIINADGKTYIVGSASARDTASYTSCIEEDHIIHFSRDNIPGVALTYPEAIISTIEKMGLMKGKLGIEIGSCTRLHLQMQWMDELRAHLTNVEFLDISDLLWKQRSIKTQAEQEVIRKVCSINEACYKKVFESIIFGRTTEMDLYRVFAQEAFRLHCENIAPMGFFFGAGRSILGNCPPSENVVIERIPQSTLFIDGGPVYKGYHSDIIRMGIVDGLSVKQKFVLDSANDALEYALDLIRDGVYAKDVSNKLDAYIQKSTAADYYYTAGWLGHGLGLDIHEEPQISTDSTYMLRTGMVLAIEPLFGSVEMGLFGNEQNIIVTEAGYELLTPSSTNPVILN